MSTIGKPMDRIDGRAKVTGAARYTADVPMENLTYAVLVPSAIAARSIRELPMTTDIRD